MGQVEVLPFVFSNMAPPIKQAEPPSKFCNQMSMLILYFLIILEHRTGSCFESAIFHIVCYIEIAS